MRARLPYAFMALAMLCAAADTVITASYQSLLDEQTWAVHGWPLATSATVGCSIMGALILLRHPRHPIGWLLCLAGLASISLVAETYSVWVLDHGGPGSAVAGHTAAWFSAFLGGPLALAAAALICLLSPDGRLASPRWRWAARAAVIGYAFYALGILTIQPADFELDSQNAELPLWTVLSLNIGVTLVLGALVASAVSIVRRLHGSTGQVRSQLLWIASSGAFLTLAFMFLVVVQSIQDGQQTLLAATPLFAAYLAFPICTAVAVLRHRLFDIDLFVNRALVVTLATGIIATGYVTVVVLLGPALGSRAGGFWPSLLAMALVAMAFQPLRRRVVRLADRLAFGAAATPYEALADFARKAGESPDPARLLPAMADAAGHAVHAARATVTLTVPGAPDEVATWSGPGSTLPAGHTVAVPVREQGEVLGFLSVDLPPGRTLRRHDHELLEGLADQAGIAFRNARLSAELGHKVEALNGQTSALLESRRRLLTAADAERARLEGSIATAVVPHLEPLPGQLAELSSAEQRVVSPAQLAPLLGAATAALEALREITRGVFPAQLSRSGLVPALTSLMSSTAGGRVVAADDSRRYDSRVEAAAYFCVTEAVRDLAPPVVVELVDEPGVLRMSIRGHSSTHLSLANMRDRVEALGGAVRSSPSAGEAVTIDVLLPAAREDGEIQDATAAAHAASSRSGPNADFVM